MVVSRVESSAPATGRFEVLISDGASVIVLDLVFRSEDVTVWLGHRTLAVIARDALAAWIDGEDDLVVDDLVWAGQGTRKTLTVDGNRTYVLDAETLVILRLGTQPAQSKRH